MLISDGFVLAFGIDVKGCFQLGSWYVERSFWWLASCAALLCRRAHDRVLAAADSVPNQSGESSERRETEDRRRERRRGGEGESAQEKEIEFRPLSVLVPSLSGTPDRKLIEINSHNQSIKIYPQTQAP